MDQIYYAYSKSKNIALSYADVTQSAKSLEQKHLSGPTAARFLAEALVSAAFLSLKLGKKDERISLQVQVDGPVGGCLVDASYDGNLRGYTTKKILNEFDDSDTTSLDEILGKSGACTFIHSNSKFVISQNLIECNPMNLRHALARFYNEIENKPTAIEISANSQDHYLNHASGVMLTRFPEGLSENFVPSLEKFNDLTVKKALDNRSDLNFFAELFELQDLKIVEHRQITSKCSCSHSKVLDSILCLPEDDHKEIVANKESTEVACHFCGQTYIINPEEVVRLLIQNKKL